MDIQHEQGIVEKVLLGGEGLIASKQGSVLLPDVIEQEHVDYRITGKRRGMLRGTTLDIQQKSPHRVVPPCPVAQTCGGCALQHISREHQARIKSSWVHDNFASLLDENSLFIPVQTEVVSGGESGSQSVGQAGRRRLRWFIDHKNNTLGFYQRQSQYVVHTTYCPAITTSLDHLRQSLEHHFDVLPKVIQSIQAINLSNGIHLILESEQAQPASFTAPELAHDFPIQWWWRISNTPSLKAINKPAISLYDHIDLQPYNHQVLPIHISANDFIQGNQQGNQTLIQQILAWTKGDKFVVDLFAGCGNLSLPIAAAHGAKIQSAELHAHSVQAANHNAQRLKLDATYHKLDLFADFELETFVAADTLIIDPPRKGAKRLCTQMQRLFPKKIIMVNCDPAAGARDAKVLHQAGFRLKSLRALDLFPFAGHVESLSLWVAR
ncbi:MAG: methyltransferase [Mariprofundaceae bacterium]|nr:methyltransferase [Mariprofundaceae bacterium]